jgi:hypothetical protein
LISDIIRMCSQRKATISNGFKLSVIKHSLSLQGCGRSRMICRIHFRARRMPSRRRICYVHRSILRRDGHVKLGRKETSGQKTEGEVAGLRDRAHSTVAPCTLMRSQAL